LAATSRHALTVLEPELYQRELDYVGVGRPALVWASDLECTPTIEKVFADSRPDRVLLFDALMTAARNRKVGVANLLL
jgi:hypothetical protein